MGGCPMTTQIEQCHRSLSGSDHSPGGGHEIRDEGVARLSPLKDRNLNVLGRYSFTAQVPAGGALRPLRAPEAPGLDEDDDGTED